MASQVSCFLLFLSFPLLISSDLLASAFITPDVTGFSYTGSTGPDRWGTLNPNFSACSLGKSQSPINIVKSEVILNRNLKPLESDYNPTNATLVDNGFNVGIRFGSNVGFLKLEGKNYTLKQMHWHSPSEHRINGEQFAAELHLVHFADDGNISVVAILYRDGKADPLVSRIQDKFNTLTKEAQAGDAQPLVVIGPYSTKMMRKHTRKYYRYLGSLTTPPCTQNVIWNVLGRIRSISVEQVADLKGPLGKPFKRNCRPIQPLNGRHVELYDGHNSN